VCILHCLEVVYFRTVQHTGVLISPYPYQEGNKIGSMSGTSAISTTSRRKLSSSSSPPPARQGKASKEIHAILTETLASFLPVRAKDLPAPLHTHQQGSTNICSHITTELLAHCCTIIVYFNKCNFSKHE